MKTSLLAGITLAVGWALAPGAGAAEFIVNGDFETGDLTGWTRVDDEGMGGGTPWTVLFDEMKGGNVAYANWDYRFFQQFEPVGAEEVEHFGMEVMTAEEASVLLELSYADGFVESVWVSTGPQWQAIDLLAELEAGRDLAGILISGPHPGPDSRIWVDNVSLQAAPQDSDVPCPECPACPEPDRSVDSTVGKVVLKTNQKRETTSVVVHLTAPEAVLLEKGEVEIKLQFIQDGSVVEFGAEAELVQVRPCDRRTVTLQDRGSRQRQQERRGR